MRPVSGWTILIAILITLALSFSLALLAMGAETPPAERYEHHHPPIPFGKPDIDKLWETAIKLSLETKLIIEPPQHAAFTVEISTKPLELGFASLYDPSTNTIYLAPPTLTNSILWAYLMIHELTHYILSQKGIPIEKHHCEMSKVGYALKTIRYMQEVGVWGSPTVRFAQAVEVDEERYSGNCELNRAP